MAIRRGTSLFQQPADPQPDTPTRADYVAIVEEADRNIGRMLDALGQHGIAHNTLVIYVSDNGGEWLSRNAPFFHRKDTLWEGGVRVPGILRWPARLPAKKVSSQVAITMDLTRTILAAAGARVADARLEGIDLMPLLTSSSPPVERTLFWRAVYASRQQRSVRSGPWKVLLDGGMQMLFDVTRDPGERNDLAAQHPEIVKKLKAQIDTWEKDVDAEAASLKR